MLALVGLTMAIIWLLPKFTKIIPAPLAGIGIVAAVVIGFGLDVPRVGDLASIQGGLPSFHMPSVPLTFETFKIILPYAVILAAIGLIESLLTQASPPHCSCWPSFSLVLASSNRSRWPRWSASCSWS